MALKHKPSTLSSRLKQALTILQCDGKPVVIEKSAVAALAKATGCVYVGLADEGPTNIWTCGQWMSRCDGCPRFQAYRQGLAAGEYWERNLRVVGRTQELKPEVSDGDRKGAEIDDVNHDQSSSVAPNSKGYLYLDSDGVLNPVTPRVVYAQHSAKNGERGGDDLNGVGLHDSNVARSEVAS